jgi:cytochrome oxidase assembly protein ShyY1
MQFRPSIKLTLTLVILALLFLRLGFWQLDRKAEKESLFERFRSAPELGIEQALAAEEVFARVEAYGRYDPERHLLLDNRIWNGRAGVHVLTPFTLVDGRSLLVNRGWLPLAPDRRSLPEFATGGEARSLRGRLVRPSVGGPRLGGADELAVDRWPQLVTYLDLDAAGTALGVPLQPWIVQLDAADESGFGDRQWTPAVMTPQVHGAYAVQWLALAVVTVIIWLTLGLRRGQLLARPGQPTRKQDRSDQE